MKRPTEKSSERFGRECVLLAAGLSSRMGEPKQLLTLGGQTLLDRALHCCLAACARVIVVWGAVDLRPNLPQRPEILAVENRDYAAGQLGSLQRGLEAVEGNAAFVTLVDLPLLRPETFEAVAQAIGDAPAAYPVYRGHRGHPVLLAPEAIARIMACEPDDKAMRALAPLGPVAVEVDDPGIAADVDTPADLQHLGSSQLLQRDNLDPPAE